MAVRARTHHGVEGFGHGDHTRPDRDLVAVFVGYYNDDQSELDVLPRLRQVLNGVFSGDAPGQVEE